MKKIMNVMVGFILFSITNLVLARSPADKSLEKDYYNNKACQQHCKLLQKSIKQLTKKLTEGCECSKYKDKIK